MGIVYMLWFEKLAYIGSTVMTLKERLQAHKDNYKAALKNKKVRKCSSCEIIKNDGYKIMVIEEVDNETEDDCRDRERWWINFYGIENLVNKYKPTATDEELKQKACLRSSKYYYSHKEKINEKRSAKKALTSAVG